MALAPSRIVRAPRGSELSAKSWQTEAPLRMLMNNLDPEVAERPDDLVVYGGRGKAARNWACFEKIVEVLRRLGDDETLLVQSGKPVGVFRTHADAPRVLIANSNIVAHWATLENCNELDRKGLTMYGQMTAGSWIYIGSQGIVQGTYETFAELGRKQYGGELAGKWILTAGLGGMGGAQPLAATMAGASCVSSATRRGSNDASRRAISTGAPIRSRKHSNSSRHRAKREPRYRSASSATPRRSCRSCCDGTSSPMRLPIKRARTIRSTDICRQVGRSSVPPRCA